MSLVTASEIDLEQTESRIVIYCGDVVYRVLLVLLMRVLNFIWNFRTVEGDSPVNILYLVLGII